MQKKPQKIQVVVVGATGYAGGELVRLLINHPQAQVAAVTSETYTGKPLAEVYPNLRGFTSLICEALNPPLLAGQGDVIFLALPHKTAMASAVEFLRLGKKVIDLSADFRLKEAKTYEEWYATTHTAKDWLPKAVYGLPEFHRAKIQKAQLVAVPGCYPTGALLALYPLVKEKVIALDTIIVDSKSGVSGAGRKIDLALHFPERNENLKAYSIATHRHTPEMEQELSLVAQKKITLSFTPHLIPMGRGILTTAYANLNKDASTQELLNLYQQYYAREPFVRVLPLERFPETKEVYGSNFCDIGLKVDLRTKRVLVISALDNLVRGASGMAIQCMNLMFGLEEKTGLFFPGVFP